MQNLRESMRKLFCRRAPVGTLKGSLRPVSEAAELGVIDPRIGRLVTAFNVNGIVSSVSSCEGHRAWLLPARNTPFVMFSTEVARAARLASRILRDYEQACELQHYWTVEATFNADSELVFSLNCPDRRFNRRRLDADMVLLAQWARESFQVSGERLAAPQHSTDQGSQ